MAINLAGFEARARKIRAVRCIRPDVRLQANCIRLAIQLTTLAGDRAVEIVAGIDLEPGLIGEELHDPPRTRRLQPRRKSKLAVTPEAVGVIIAPAVAQLLIAFTNALAHTARLAEVERRAGNAARRFGQRNGGGVDREEMPGGDHECVIENGRARCCALEIE